QNGEKKGKWWGGGGGGRGAAAPSPAFGGAGAGKARQPRRADGYTQPLSSRSAICQITSMPGALSLRQGIAAKFSPPYFLKIRAPSTAISSSVSRQSAEKPGMITATFFTPLLARFLRVRLVRGSSHLPRQNRD